MCCLLFFVPIFHHSKLITSFFLFSMHLWSDRQTEQSTKEIIMITKKSSLLDLTTRNSALSKSFKVLSKNQYGKCGNSMHQKKIALRTLNRLKSHRKKCKVTHFGIIPCLSDVKWDIKVYLLKKISTFRTKICTRC